MKPENDPKRPSVHFSGIGGTAMVAGARLALDAGWQVRGSDNPLYPPTSELVTALGVPACTGYAAENLDWNPDVVVLGNVLSRGNPEVEAALSRRMRFISLPEWLKDYVLRARRPIAVCGTHGKTTTTALAAHLLDQCGLAPGFLIGGQPGGFAHSARLGGPGGWFVIEGDEYDTAFFDKRAKFLHYLPEVAIVTAVEFDHGDIYPDLAAIELAFQRLLRQLPRDGLLILCADNAARALARHAFCPVTTYGTAPDADWRVEMLGVDDGRELFRLHHAGRVWGEFETPLAGAHNVLNAAAALAAAAHCGAEAPALAKALAGFRGVRRRMDVFLEADGVAYVDDFAHHPTAIRETIAAARRLWPGRRLRVLFEPRSNTTVTTRFQEALIDAFAEADETWFGPIHRVEAIPEGERLDRAAVVDTLRQKGRVGGVEDDPTALAARIVASAKPGDVVLILSNGAFGGIYARLRELVTGA